MKNRPMRLQVPGILSEKMGSVLKEFKTIVNLTENKKGNKIIFDFEISEAEYPLFAKRWYFFAKELVGKTPAQYTKSQQKRYN